MPATPAMEQLLDELDDLGATKVRYLRVVDRAIADGFVSEEKRQEISIERRQLKSQFRVVSRRTLRIASGNRMLRLLANTGEITPKAERLFRELTEDQARIANVVPFPSDSDDPDDGGPNLLAA